MKNSYTYSSTLLILLVSLSAMMLIGIATVQVMGLSVWFTVPASLEFLNLPSIGIVVGGLLLSAAWSFPLGVLGRLIARLKFILRKPRSPLVIPHRKIAEDAVITVRQVSPNGARGFANVASQHPDPFAAYLLTLIGTNYNETLIDLMADQKRAAIQEDAALEIGVCRKMADAAPAFGMLGTILGLIYMLSNFQDVNELGLGLSFAMMTTLYGLLISYLLFHPLANALEMRAIHQDQINKAWHYALREALKGTDTFTLIDQLHALDASLELKEDPLSTSTSTAN